MLLLLILLLLFNVFEFTRGGFDRFQDALLMHETLLRRSLEPRRTART